MCGRFAVTTDPAQLAEKITAIDEATGCGGGKTSYNVAPTDTIATVVSRHSEPDDEPTRRVRLMRWGLIPSWIKAGPGGAPDAKGPPLITPAPIRSPRRRRSGVRSEVSVAWCRWTAGTNGASTPTPPRGGRTPRRRSSCTATTRPVVHGRAVVGLEVLQVRPTAAELHGDHHRCRGRAGRDP